jgi:hypothetical protein
MLIALLILPALLVPGCSLAQQEEAQAIAWFADEYRWCRAMSGTPWPQTRN